MIHHIKTSSQTQSQFYFIASHKFLEQARIVIVDDLERRRVESAKALERAEIFESRSLAHFHDATLQLIEVWLRDAFKVENHHHCIVEISKLNTSFDFIVDALLTNEQTDLHRKIDVDIYE